MSKKVIGIVHNIPLSSIGYHSQASDDVLVQVEAVEYTLKKLGYTSRRIPFTKDVAMFLDVVKREHIDMAINLCETVDEDPAFAGHPAALLELVGIPFTGSSSIAIMITTDKVLTKRLLRGRGTRTPGYLIYDAYEYFNTSCLRFPVIVKPRYEDASIGIDQESIFETHGALKKNIKDFYNRFGFLIVEEYIEGREFNVSLFGYPNARVMPIAEIDFSQFPDSLYHVVGYRAKWDSRSFEYQHTPRKFSPTISQWLQREIERVASECFTFFMLRDYGRVDVRIDENGKIYVLEVNANPCVSPDAGFPAALEHAGMTYTDMVRSFVEFMDKRTSYGDQTFHIPRQG